MRDFQSAPAIVVSGICLSPNRRTGKLVRVTDRVLIVDDEPGLARIIEFAAGSPGWMHYRSTAPRNSSGGTRRSGRPSSSSTSRCPAATARADRLPCGRQIPRQGGGRERLGPALYPDELHDRADARPGGRRNPAEAGPASKRCSIWCPASAPGEITLPERASSATAPGLARGSARRSRATFGTATARSCRLRENGKTWVERGRRRTLRHAWLTLNTITPHPGDRGLDRIHHAFAFHERLPAAFRRLAAA
jgi:hypothetical protein